MTILSDQMALGARLARHGEREQARKVFNAIVLHQPTEVDAWLWLSELSDTLDDQISALEKAAHYFSNEGDESQNLQERLNTLRGGPALPPPGIASELQGIAPMRPRQETSSFSTKPHSNHSENYQKAERCYLVGDHEKAFQLLAELLKETPAHQDALLLVNELEVESGKKAALLETVLKMAPGNDEVTRCIASVHLSGHEQPQHNAYESAKLSGFNPLQSLTRRLFSR